MLGRELGGRVGSNPTTMCNLMIILWGCRKKDLQGISNPSHAGSSPVSPTNSIFRNMVYMAVASVSKTEEVGSNPAVPANFNRTLV